jgi:transcriptional regulator with XRE-family HTH domain
MARRSFSARLGARLRARREALGLTQAALAERASLTSNYVGVLERGLKIPTIETLMTLAKALETTLAELVGDTGVKDSWVDEVLAVASTVPDSRRDLTLAVLKTMAAKR